MKYRLVIFILVTIIVSSCLKSKEINIGKKEYTFPEPISSVSKGKDCVWIGSLLGSIFAFKNGLYTQYFIHYGRVYQVVEVSSSDSIVLVGIRNAGLKMVKLKSGRAEIIKNYKIRIPYKGENNYSPYGLLLRNDTIFVGTSNGLFYAPITIPSKNQEDEYLTLLHPSHQTQGYRFFSLLANQEKIYAASNHGLFIVSGTNPPKVDSITSRGGINHFCLYKDKVYALNSNAELFCTDNPDSTITTYDNKPLIYFRDSLADWALSNTNAVISDLKNSYKKYTFDCSLAIGGDNSRSRAGLINLGDFTYIATTRSLLEVPRHINFFSSMSIISACYDKEQDVIYAVTTQNDLFKISPSGEKSEFLQHIESTEKDAVKKLLGVIGNWLYYETAERLFKIKLNEWTQSKEVALNIRQQKKEIYNGYFSENKQNLVVSYSDSIFRYYPDKDSSVSITPVYDFYPTVISEIGAAKSYLLVGSLNYGLWMEKNNKKLSSSTLNPRTILSVAALNDSTIAVLSPARLYKMTNHHGAFYATDSISVPIDLNKLIYSDNRLFALSLKGGIMQFDLTDLRLHQTFFRDILFHKEGSFSYGKSLVLSSDLGLAIVNANNFTSLKWIPITNPSYITRLLKLQYPIELLGWIALFVLLFFGITKVYRSELYKKIARKLQITIKEREERIHILELKSKELKEDIETSRNHFEKLQQDRDEWSTIRKLITEQRRNEIVRLQQQAESLHLLVNFAGSEIEFLNILDCKRVYEDSFLLSADYWTYRNDIIKVIELKKKQTETNIRKSIDENKSRIAAIKECNAANDLLVQINSILNNKESELVHYCDLNQQTEDWLYQFSKYESIIEITTDLQTVLAKLPSIFVSELNKLSLFIQETKFNHLSYSQWNKEFNRLIVEFEHFDSVSLIYKDLLWNSILSEIDTMYPQSEIISLFRNKLQNYHFRNSSKGNLESILYLTNFRVQLSRLKIIGEIGELYTELGNLMNSSMKKKIDNGQLNRKNFNYQQIKEIQQKFDGKIEEFYKELTYDESRVLKVVGLVKSGSLYRKLLLLQLFNYHESTLSNTYIITRSETEDAKDTLRDRRSELKSEKIKPNIDKLISCNECSVISMTIQIVAEHI